MAKDSSDTRSEIIQAAQSAFLDRGYEGARTQYIADQIGVTKAMIHYYFNTKKELFEHVYGRSAELMFEGISEKLEKEIPLFKKIEQLIKLCLQKSDEHADVLGFVLAESKRNPDWLLPILKERIALDTKLFARQIDEAASKYMITAVDPNQLLLNIFSLCYYPAVSSSVNGAVIGEQSLQQLLAQRKGIVLDTVLNWLTA